MTQIIEGIAISLAGNDDKCLFEHEPGTHDKKNKIPPDHENKSGTLGRALKGESHHVKTAKIDPEFELLDGSKMDEAGFSPHHILPGNEMWNDKGHPLHAWVHKDVEGKVKGDIGYVNNAKYNGIDLPSHHKFSGWAGANPLDQNGYAFAAMEADAKKRQFHDAHKAYSDMVWKALEKISEKLDQIEDKKGCGDKNCPAAQQKPYDPPYGVLAQLRGVASRLKAKLWGDEAGWQEPLMTSRFGVMYKTGGRDQELARQALVRYRDQMGRPTG